MDSGEVSFPFATSCATATMNSPLPDVGINDIQAPQKIKLGQTKKIAVKVKNFSNGPQTRTVTLYLNGILVDSNILVTLGKGKQQNVNFEVQFKTPGLATVQAGLFPGDINADNDKKTETLMIVE